MRLTLPGFVICAASALARIAAGDTIYLTDGRKLEGTAIEHGDTVTVQTPIGSMDFPRAKVLRIEKGLSPSEEYPVRLKKLGASPTVEHRLALARWCREKKIFREMRAEYEAVLALDPDQIEAREALGYVHQDGRWMTREEAMTAQGFVRYKNEWIPKAEKERREGEERVQVLLMKANGYDAKAAAAAKAELETIPPEYRVAGALTKMGDSMRPVRRMAIDLIGGAMPGVEEAWAKNGGYADQMKYVELKWKVVERLVRSTVADRDEEVRKSAWATVKSFGSQEAVPWLEKSLVEGVGGERIRSALALEDLGERASVAYLIYTLYYVTIEIRATVAQLDPGPVTAGIYPLNVSTFLGQNADQTLVARVQIETPRIRIASVRTTVTAPGGETIEMERDAIVHALQGITEAKLGPDTKAWLAWWDKSKAEYGSPNAMPAKDLDANGDPNAIEGGG
ncbi:MAG: hypothetical protein HYY93_08960 [Planctomycetes bacterium]|nr:hypothetical protein [Planctomycetota bacterium]